MGEATGTANAAGIRNCAEIETQIEKIAAEVQERIKAKSDEKQRQMNADVKAIQDDVPNTSGADAKVGLDIDVSWKDTEILVPWIEITVDSKQAKLDLPQVKMSNKEFIFHTPSVRMVNKKVGQYPEVKCSGLKCTVTWSDIITKVPETFMEEQRVVMGIPEFWVDTTTIDIPEIKVEFSQKRIVMGLPQFKVVNISAASKDLQDRSTRLSERYEAEFKAMAEEAESGTKARTAQKVHDLFDCHRGNLVAQQDATVQSIEAQIKAARTHLEAAKAQGVGDAVKQIQDSIKQMTDKKSEIAAQFDDMVAEMNQRETEAIRGITDAVEDELEQAAQ